MPEHLAAAVSGSLSRLAALMRAGGAHVGVGDLLAAHRALAAVDAAQREEAFYALRAALCSSHADLTVFAEAFAIAVERWQHIWLRRALKPRPNCSNFLARPQPMPNRSMCVTSIGCCCT